MNSIKYYDEELEEYKEMPKELFVKEYSWNLPYNFVKKVADEDEEIRMQLYHQLLRRTRVNPYIEELKNSHYYNDLVREIISNNYEIEKIDLAIYFENDFIETEFGGINNLVERIINYDKKDEFYNSLAMRLVDISNFDIDDSTKERIIEGIDILIDKDYEEMEKIGKEFNLPSGDANFTSKLKERDKSTFIEKVNANHKTHEK